MRRTRQRRRRTRTRSSSCDRRTDGRRHNCYTCSDDHTHRPHRMYYPWVPAQPAEEEMQEPWLQRLQQAREDQSPTP